MAVNYSVANEILAHIGSDNMSGWYIGIATNPRNRLFSGHNVSEQYGSYIARDAGGEQHARDTENYLLQSTRCKGGCGGGDCPRYVYAYKITSTTVQ